MISIDCKKKELVGQFKNGGREWRPKGDPEQVKVHDFMDKQLGKAIPYGVYDLGANTGWVSVGVDHETSPFAVNTLRSWWAGVGKDVYPGAARLLITADSGGANGSRRRAWKTSWLRWPPRPDWRSASVTSRRAPASGTKSSTGCSPRSPATGAAGP